MRTCANAFVSSILILSWITMKVVVIYESTRGRTEAMAKAICEGVSSNGQECEVVNAKDFNGLKGACALAVGSSTRMRKALPHVRRLLAEMTNLDGIPSAAFGSYGWSGEAPDTIAEELAELGGYLLDEQPVKAREMPNREELELCRNLGKRLAASCNS
ncbi:MAG: flavodoxin domain-containing protein [Promethearchaeia archaeon]